MPEYASKKRFPKADQTAGSAYEDAFSVVKVGQSGCIITVAHGHKGDEVALAGAMRTLVRYIAAGKR